MTFEEWWGEPPMEVTPCKPRGDDDDVRIWVWQAWQAATMAEREACAKVCDMYENGRHENMADVCADKIRARSNEGGT